ncbi:MAG: ABC transporter ATP-binding protein [Dehalococcoidia bacterium]
MLNLNGVSKSYGGKTVVSDVQLSLERGTVAALLGANGAGKTTLIKCIVGLISFEGDIEVGGIDVRRHSKEARRQIGYLAQNPGLHADLTVGETAVFHAELKGVASRNARLAIETAGLEAHADKAVGLLSGGMRQRLALALALLADPPFLIFDEPAAGLDTGARLELRRLVQEQKSRGKAILLATHWLEDVPYIADQALVLERGLTVFAGPAAKLEAAGAPTSRLYLRLNGHGAEAMDLLRTMPRVAGVALSGDWLAVTCSPDRKAEVVETLVNARLKILDLRVDESRVEEALLHLRDGVDAL